jgi:AcrR family transcriptional regulator
MTPTAARRQRRDKAATEQALLDAALDLLHRDGVLVGLNMQEVADRAGVSRGLIHHHFGSRRALMRAALTRELGAGTTGALRWRATDPKERNRRSFRQLVKNPDAARMLALLLIDQDESLKPLPFLEERLSDSRREQAEGKLPPDVDHEAVAVLWDSLALGYTLLRESAARQLQLGVAALDGRMVDVLDEVSKAVAAAGQRQR